MKTLRIHLEDQFAVIDRVAKPVRFSAWFCFVALMVTGSSYCWWAFWVMVCLLASYLIAIGQIHYPRCDKRLGVLSQTQAGGRRRQRLPLENIQCPHCRLTLDYPVP